MPPPGYRFAIGPWCHRGNLAAAPPSSRWPLHGLQSLPPPGNAEGWSELVKEIWGSKARKITRHATRKDVPFDIDRLKSVELPAGFVVEPIDRKWFDYCTQTPWCRDFVSQYETYEQYA